MENSNGHHVKLKFSDNKVRKIFLDDNEIKGVDSINFDNFKAVITIKPSMITMSEMSETEEYNECKDIVTEFRGKVVKDFFVTLYKKCMESDFTVEQAMKLFDCYVDFVKNQRSNNDDVL